MTACAGKRANAGRRASCIFVRGISLRTFRFVGYLILSCFVVSGHASELYRDADQPIRSRVADLLSRMTVEEKVAQMQGIWLEARQLDREFDFQNGFASADFLPERATEIMPLGIGHIGRPSQFKSPLQNVQYTNAIQQWLVNHTRLGIPAIFHEEALHGHTAPEGTSFPQAIALASTWDAELIKRVYTVAAQEMRARGGSQALTPILDVARDPRWGRIEETMGEDPYLIAELGVAAVTGFQGDTASTLIPNDRVLATLKHLAGHGQPIAGLNVAPTHVGERELREVFLYPFEAAVSLGNARSVMASYNEIDGVPSHANKKLLTDILRNEWGFSGILVSDYSGIEQILKRHHLGGTEEDAAEMAIRAGVDMELPDRSIYPLLPGMVREGRIDISDINTAVARILGEKFRLGLFENPYAEENSVTKFINNGQHRALALEAAQKAMVLLKNDGLLPLSDKKIGSVAVIGPHADETLLGGYSDIPRQTVPILDGLRTRLAGKATVSFARGARITTPVVGPLSAAIKAKTLSRQRWIQKDASVADQSDSRRLLEEAVKLAKKSDVTILVVGGNEATSREALNESHLGDRTNLTLVGNQDALVRAVLNTGTPTVLVLTNGRPLAMEAIYEAAPAIIEAWYLGQETGTAVANVLFGDVSPGGKLPVTFPRNVGQVPLYYNYRPTARRGYLYSDSSPQFHFGHGLSYTSFEYSDLQMDESDVQANDVLKARLTVKNTGDRDGEEVVQFYIHDRFASVTRPVQELKGFYRIALAASESAILEFELPINVLGFYDSQMAFVVEPGEVELQIGSSSDDIRLRDVFTVTGKTTVIDQDDKAYLSGVTVIDRMPADDR